MTDTFPLGPKPTTITGGCLCAKLRYEVTLPEDHDFIAASMTCQCTQCRKQSGALVAVFHTVPPLRWTSDDTSTFAEFRASEAATRGICTACGSWLYYRGNGQEGVSLCVGTIDEDILFGKKGADGEDEKKGFGRALASGLGGHVYCENEIPGVTDDIPMLKRGKRYEAGDS
ncbi:glutathione-dependent formaldehyde-activating enzyme [Colletotrichum musicola]|uniref:Glutathione-dependent formaldehyde-activating enzyme n=1 Tax=Colletotrichum musicola TaxID=2175873 RepID=A0A8H6K1J4_9PEZI|nr:glutathione-dependent formaldehyde-activating enzyme [Colletotrichum musicola]